MTTYRKQVSLKNHTNTFLSGQITQLTMKDMKITTDNC